MLSADDFEYLRDIFGPLIFFAVFYVALYRAIRRFRNDRRLVNSRNLKCLDFVWLSVAAVGLYFAGEDTVKADAAVRAANAREDYRIAFYDLKRELDPQPGVCALHYIKSLASPPDFDAAERQQRFDCEWARKVKSQLPALDRPNFEEYRFTEMPSLRKEPHEASIVDNLLRVRKRLEVLHEEAFNYSRVSEYVERQSGGKKGGVYLLAAALAVRFGKVHGELALDHERHRAGAYEETG
jgi:hypothetical protein